MEYVKLGDYCTITSSKRIFADQYVSTGIPFYRSKEIIEKNNNQMISEPLYISVDVFNKIKKRFGAPKSGDILLTSVGTLGIPYFVKDETFYFKDGNLTWMKDFSENLDSRYVYYWLSSSFGKQSLLQRAIGSSQPAITIDILRRYKIALPYLSNQRRIASILSAYDNLIENNNKRIRLLEQMAENLYKEWFVRFRFPGHEKVKFENGLPKGWKEEKLSNEFTTSSGGTPSRGNTDYYLGTIPWIKTGELLGTFILDTEEHITEDAVNNSSAKIISPYSLLIAMYAGTNVGNMGINTMKATCNQACCVIESRGNYSLYYLKLFIKKQKSFLQSISFGAAQQNISQDIIKKLKVIYPTKDLCDKFHNRVSIIYKDVEYIMRQNQNLTRQRDLLLPRLMSGKLEVKE